MHTLSKFSLVAAAVIIGLSFGMPEFAAADSANGTAATGGSGTTTAPATKHQTRKAKRHARHQARHEKRHVRHEKRHPVEHPVAAVKGTGTDAKDRGRDGGGRNGGDRMNSPAPGAPPTNDRGSRGAGSVDTPPTDQPKGQ